MKFCYLFRVLTLKKKHDAHWLSFWNKGLKNGVTVHVVTGSHIESRWIPRSLEETVSWICLEFKPMKSRCLVIRKGSRKMSRLKYKVQSIVDNPIKCFEKGLNSTIRDNTAINLREGWRIDQTPSRKVDVDLSERLIWQLMFLWGLNYQCRSPRASFIKALT